MDQAISNKEVPIIILVSFGVYFNALFNGFLGDDIYQVLGNRWIKDVTFIPDIFFTNVWSFKGGQSNYYRPLMHLIYMVAYYLFGLKPWGFHLVNILFHSGVSILVFLFTSKLLRGSTVSIFSSHFSLPFIVAILFATHPIHTEVVTPVMGIVDLSLTFFYLLSFYLYIRSREGVPWSYLFSVVTFFIAALCKEPALTLPLLLLAYDYVNQKERYRLFESLKRVLPYLLVTGVYLVLRFVALGGIVTSKIHTELSPIQYFINIFPLFSQYLEKLLLPVNLNFLHTFRHITSLLETKGILSLAVTAAFAVLTYLSLKKSQIVFVGLLLTALPLLPALYIPALNQVLLNAFAERYLYLSSVGFVLVLGLSIVWAKERIFKSGVALSLAFLGLAGIYSMGTLMRNPIWMTNFTLFTDTVKKSPNDPIARNHLGKELMDRGDIDKAIEEFQCVLRLKPDFAMNRNHLGVAYGKKGWTQKAIEQIQIALKIAPGFAEAHNNLGVIFGNVDQVDKAIEQFRTAIQLDPDFEEAYRNLGVAYSNKGQTDKAIKYLQAALRLNPEDAEAHNNLGIGLATIGSIDQAIEHFKTAVKLNPVDPDFQTNLVKALKIKGS